MIVKMDFYTVQCNSCGEHYQDEERGFAGWNCENGALESATEDGWEEIDDKHYCPKCFTYDDDGEPFIHSLPDNELTMKEDKK